jgi:tetratricopeptide (TPR) repeat protein
MGIVPDERKPGVVTSIVAELERRQLVRARKLAEKTHRRELMAKVEMAEATHSLEHGDGAEALQELSASSDPEAVLAAAQLRCARALVLCGKGEVKEGLAEWEAVLAENPRMAYAYVLRARFRLHQGDVAAALADLERAAEADPTESGVYIWRGRCHEVQGDFERALANFRRAAALDPTEDVLHSLAQALTLHGDAAEATAAWNRLIAAAPGYVDFHQGRAAHLAAQGEHAGALRDHQRIVELDPTADAFAERARAHLALGHAKEALADFDRSLEMDPSDEIVAIERAKAMTDTLPQEEAGPRILAEIHRLAAAFPESAYFAELLGIVLAGKNDHEGAFAAFDRALTLDPELDGDTYLKRAIEHAHLGHAQEAFDDATRAIERTPDLAQAWVARAVYRTHLDEEDCHFAEALADLDRALELEPDNVTAHFNRAEVLSGMDEHEEAFASIERAVAVAPRNGRLYYERAVYRENLHEEPDEAAAASIADCDRALALGYRDADVFVRKADEQRFVGDIAGALATVEAAILEHSEDGYLYFCRSSFRGELGDEAGRREDEARAEALGFRVPRG